MAQQLKTDWILFLTIVLMVCFGLIMVYSASNVMAGVRFHDSNYFLLRQMGWAVVSFLALMYFKRKNYHRLGSPTWAFAPLGVVLAMLVLVYFLDRSAHRWLRYGSVGLQPAEFAKPALVIFLAWFVTRRAHAINAASTLIPVTLALGVLAGSVLVADLGTAAVLVFTAAVVLYVAGLERRYFLMAIGVCVLVLPLAILAKPYRVHRVISYIDPEHKILDMLDPAGRIKQRASQSVSTRDAGYQVRQSKIAVATGGALGLGVMESRQKLLYLPEAHNDFIYAVVGEELGLWGATAVIAGYLVILWRGLRLYFIIPDDFGRYLALGVSVAIVVQAFLNISVVLDMAPTKGFPLPLISYGGSSLLSSLTSLGILLSVADHSG